MRTFLAFILMFATAAAIGLGATWLAASGQLAFANFSAGAWTASPKIGTSEADPYARAALARSGALPLAAGDGFDFVARTDDAGNDLNGRCDTVVSGSVGPARYWTLTLYNRDGGLVDNAVGRSGFTSAELLWRANGAFEIAIAPRARAGNWLPSGGGGRFMLVLRRYDAGLDLATPARRTIAMPSITRGACP